MFWEMEVPELVQVAEVMRQQTPNPAAHPPEAEPLLDVHSVEVTQVPVRPLVAVQASLGNWTTENRPMGLGAEELRPMATMIKDSIGLS